MTRSRPTPRRDEGPVRTLFFGSGAFAVPILEVLRTLPEIDLVGVVTTPDRPAGRTRRPAPTPVAARASDLGLPLLQPASLRTADARVAIAETRPELAVLADYGRIVPAEILALPARGFVNLHPSLLPRHRGATSIAAAILAGDAETGVTLFQMDDELDTGPVVAQVRWSLPDDAMSETLETEAAARAAGLLATDLPAWLEGAREARPQDDARATMTRPFSREDGRLDADRPARELERRVRALAPWPGTFVETPDTRIVVLRVASGPSAAEDVPGLLVADDGGLGLATIEGRLRLLQVRPAGGRSMSGAELRRGRPRLVGQKVVGPDRGVAASGIAR